MKHDKSKGGAGGLGAGISGLTQNYGAYHHWGRTLHEKCKIVDVTNSLADLHLNSSDRHRDLRPIEVKKGELAIQSTIEAVQSFVNPFSISDKEHLYSISSGMKVPTDIETDVMRAEEIGEKEKERFVNERLQPNEKFFDPIKRTNLKTMEDLSKKSKITTKQNKVIELKQQGNIAFQLLVGGYDC